MKKTKWFITKSFKHAKKNSEAALKVAQESQSQSSETSSEHSSEAEIESSIPKLEEYLVENSRKFSKDNDALYGRQLLCC